ncbi:hypothetical protein LptCag_0972 [Leptospirillum ferriphilum]|uniref:Uncharacterized protein n=1 Tax=Leptospirillum ferriphilum TaxID=178606 RepID=A0A094X6L8_9BACT|nr:hypothetical protein LptCag_0972 [Leptospirillum ferriphilum]
MHRNLLCHKSVRTICADKINVSLPGRKCALKPETVKRIDEVQRPENPHPVLDTKTQRRCSLAVWNILTSIWREIKRSAPDQF